MAKRLIRHRWIVAFVVAFATAFFGWRASKLEMSTSLADLLPHRHAFLDTHNRYARQFGGADSVTVLVETRRDSLFDAEHLSQLFLITQAVARLPGVNHYQIDSIAHRSARRLRVTSGQTLRSEPVMLGMPKNERDVASIRRAVHESESIYGKLVSLDDRAALIRANFVEGALDYRRLFDEVNEQVLIPYTRGWVGAEFARLDRARAPKLGLEPGIGLSVVHVFPEGSAAKAGLREGDVVILINGQTAHEASDVGKAMVAGAEGVEIGYLRAGKPHTLTLTSAGSDLEIHVAGEPRLYGWIYDYAREIVWIFVAVTAFSCGLLYLYFHDWRGALRPLITGAVAATWGLGFIEMVGLALDPLALVIPFFITARAVSHSVQMHDRYYQEYLDNGFEKRAAILKTFAGMFVPTLSGILTDALGVLVMILVPVVMLQKLAITAAFWILSITVAELVLNPIIYDLLRAPDPVIAQRRAAGLFYYLLVGFSRAVLSPTGRAVTLGFWLAASLVCATQWSKLQIGDATSATPLLAPDSPYNIAHARIQARFGGVEPLIVVAEGFDRDAMKDPHTLATIERLQRHLERDPAVGSSFSLADLARTIGSTLHDLEPKWGVLPEDDLDLANLFFLYFSGSTPAETARYVSGDFQSAPMTFYTRGHQGSDVARVVARAEDFIERNPMDKAAFKLAGGPIGVVAATNQEVARNDVLMNVLAYGAIFLVVLLTYRSAWGGLIMLLPLLVANFAVNAYMGWQGLGVNIHTLPVVTVGVGFGIDFGLYLVSRTRETYASLEGRYRTAQEAERMRASLLEAMTSSGKGITLTALVVVAAALFWTTSRIRFDAEMGLLLSIWMAMSWAASLTLLPVLLVVLRPKFIQRRIPVR